MSEIGKSSAIHMYWWKGDLERRRFFSNLIHRIRCGFPMTIRNFGDQLSPVIVEKLSRKPVVYSKRNGKLVALGSLFANVRSGDTVWGTGVMGPNMPIACDPRQVIIKAVRGPLSRKVLLSNGFDCPEIYGDPGALLPFIYQCPVEKKYRIGILPHFEDCSKILGVFDDPSIKIIHPLQDFRQIIADINKCELVLSSSLHGIIVSEAYKVPSCFFVMSCDTGGGLFKYEDYYASTNRALSFVDWRERVDLRLALRLAESSTPAPQDMDPLLLAFPHLASDIGAAGHITAEEILEAN